MRKVIFLLVLLTGSRLYADLGLGLACKEDVAQGVVSGILTPIPGATIRVCNRTATTTVPCSPLATIFTDDVSGVQINQTANPLTADSAGNYTICAKADEYVVQVSGAGFSTLTQPFHEQLHITQTQTTKLRQKLVTIRQCNKTIMRPTLRLMQTPQTPLTCTFQSTPNTLSTRDIKTDLRERTRPVKHHGPVRTTKGLNRLNTTQSLIPPRIIGLRRTFLRCIRRPCLVKCRLLWALPILCRFAISSPPLKLTPLGVSPHSYIK